MSILATQRDTVEFRIPAQTGGILPHPPWCVRCDKAPEDMANEHGHGHTGESVMVETTSYNKSAEDGSEWTVAGSFDVAVTRFDDEHPNGPLAGEVSVFVEAGTCETYMTPQQALQLAHALATRARIAMGEPAESEWSRGFWEGAAMMRGRGRRRDAR